MDSKYLERVTRQLGVLGKPYQEKLHSSRLCVAGGGGNGSLAGIGAALMGFRRISLVDPDKLESVNLNRSFLWGEGVDASLGRPKVEILAETLRRIDPSIEAVPIVSRIESREGATALRNADAVLLCVDENRPRVFANRRSAELRIPVLDLGTGGLVRDGRLRTLGWRVSLFVPGYACLECIYLDNEPMPHSQLSYLPLNLQAVGLGLDLLVACVTGCHELNANHVVGCALTGVVERMMVSRREDCPVCGTRVARQSHYGSVTTTDNEPPMAMARGRALLKGQHAAEQQMDESATQPI